MPAVTTVIAAVVATVMAAAAAIAALRGAARANRNANGLGIRHHLANLNFAGDFLGHRRPNSANAFARLALIAANLDHHIARDRDGLANHALADARLELRTAHRDFDFP